VLLLKPVSHRRLGQQVEPLAHLRRCVFLRRQRVLRQRGRHREQQPEERECASPDEHGQPAVRGDACQADLKGGKAGGENRAAAATEDKPERSNKFRTELAPERHVDFPEIFRLARVLAQPDVLQQGDEQQGGNGQRQAVCTENQSACRPRPFTFS
jgi:hypothetical protein